MSCPPEGDITTSSEPGDGRLQQNASTESSTPHFPGIAQGDQSSSQSSTGTIQGRVFGSAGPQNNKADAFYGSEEYRNEPSRSDGPEVERQSLDDNRPLHDMHIGTVSARSKKQLLHDLVNTVNLTDAEKKIVDSLLTRKDKVNKVLEFWRIRASTRTVKDLIELLQQAGGQEEKYDDLIRHLRQCPA